MNKKILILGNGFIGSNLYNYFQSKYDTTITNRSILDILNPETYKNINWHKFDIIIYTIGLKDVPFCELNPKLSFDINGNYIDKLFPLILNTTKFIYISTDYVFDGNIGNYSEFSETIPSTIYGKSKLKGEQITHKHPNHIIARTSAVYGDGCIWLKKLISTLDSNNTMECYMDIYNTPTYSINLAEMLDCLFINDFCGKIHICGSSSVNRLDFYSTIATIFNRSPYQLYGGFAPPNRFPMNLTLSNKKYCSLFKNIPNDIVTGLTRLKSNYAH